MTRHGSETTAWHRSWHLGAIAAVPPLTRRWQQTRWLLAASLLLVVAVGVWIGAARRPFEAPPAETTSAPAKLVARGQVRPVLQAKVATLNGGRVTQLGVEVGRPVAAEQEIARVRAADGSIEILTAPWPGWILTLPVHLGDTVMPGAVVTTVGDVSRLQVETTDVDEFVVPYVNLGGWVTVTVDALDDRALLAQVRSISLEPETTTTGDEHYRVVLDLTDVPPALRAGMTVRMRFDEGADQSGAPPSQRR